MLAAGDWVIYAIPIIAFLVWILSSALRPAQPPPVARPRPPQGSEPVVLPEAPAARREEIPVVMPVESEAKPRDRLEEFIERRRQDRTRTGPRPPRRPPPRRPSVVVIQQVPPTVAEVVPVEPVVVVRPEVTPPQAIPVVAAIPSKPSAGEAARVLAAEPAFIPAQLSRRSPAPALVALSRLLERPEDLRTVFLAREVFGPPKGLRWLAQSRQ
ncbi:MAG: hypothetical protein RMJ19_02715 [Gemmatales bacterium]|nr:hypothetical protein [Gemmatales bacterium]MDW8174561.1 hypothetical protein [Gemmatales bacterium]